MKKGLAGLVCALIWLPAPARAADPEPTVVEEILGVLTERGLLDAGEHDRMVARYHQQEKERSSLLPRIRLTGDLRVRGEGFWFDEDATGQTASSRFRGRYRLRLGADAEVQPWLLAHFRLASGEDDNRSSNTSFGRPDEDFDPDPIFLDRASIELRAPEGRLPFGADASLEVGKVPNPFVWKATRDTLLWDNDIMPEGLAGRLTAEIARGLSGFANAGYFILDENTSTRDPHLAGVQLGGAWEASEVLTVGARATFYAFRSLDEDFVLRGVDGTGGSTAAAGNIVDGLTSSSERIHVGELGAYLRWAGCERWPVALFGHLSRNFSARASELFPDAGEEDLAWSAGLQVGDKAEIAALGVAYYWLEANAFPSQLVDSDTLDGTTNRRGFAFTGTRELVRNADLQLTLFWSDEIEDALPAFEESVGGADRLRLQTDLVVGF
jgi:hypothetical protein